MPSEILLRSEAWQSTQEWRSEHPEEVKNIEKNHRKAKYHKEDELRDKKDKETLRKARRRIRLSRTEMIKQSFHANTRSRKKSKAVARTGWRVQGGFCDGHGKRDKWEKDS
jgi:hypothetical protein